MALKMMDMSVLAILVIALCTGTTAQSSCINVITSMSPCLNYLTGNSSKPSSSCCSQFSDVVRSQPECLCQVLSGSGSQPGLGIKPMQALQLPDVCNVQTPPISQCNDSPPGASDTPSRSGPGNREKNVPSTDADSSNGSYTTLPSIILIIVISAVSYASF